jgi:hypothetical protein
VAFVVLDGAEDLFAEKAFTLGFVRAVVDGLGFEHLAARLGENLLGRSKPDGDFREDVLCFIFFSKSHISCLQVF